MARVGNTTNLRNNSRYDILTYDYPEGYPKGRIYLQFGRTPRRITGVQKVSQTFLRCLLSNTGSDVLYPTRGSSFPQFSGGRNLQSTDSLEINAEISNAVQQAAEQAKSILSSQAESLDSQLDYVTVQKVEHISDSTSVRIKVVTLAGEAAPIALPFTSLGLEINE